MTGQQLVNAALTILGVLTQGESPSTSESSDARTAANDMLASWSLERLNIFTIGAAAHTLVSGTASYTIGSGGVFSVARPIRYQKANILIANAGATGKLVMPLEIVGPDAWSEVLERAAAGVVPRILYPDMASPLTTLNLWPTPTFTGTAPQLELWTWSQLQEFADLITNYTFPPGYDRALKFNLAVEIASMFGVVPTNQVLQTAAEAKASLRMANATVQGVDPASGQVNALAPAPAVVG